MNRRSIVGIRVNKMNLLFICSQNKRRSLTAEKIFNGYNGHKAYSAGTEANSGIKVTPGLLNISDDYGFMDRELQELLESYVYEYIL